MKKRIWTVLLSAALALSVLSGCGESRETGGSARTKEESRKERTREASKEDSEESGDASSEESGQKTTMRREKTKAVPF